MGCVASKLEEEEEVISYDSLAKDFGRKKKSRKLRVGSL